MPRPLHDEDVNKAASQAVLSALTLDVIVDFLVVGLVLKLDLVGHYARMPFSEWRHSSKARTNRRCRSWSTI
jgi:hypothetical protein